MWKVPEDFRGLSIDEGERFLYLSAIPLPHEKMGQGEGPPPPGNRCGFDFQGKRFLYHRLPKRRLQTGCQKRRGWRRREREARRSEVHGEKRGRSFQAGKILPGVK